MGSYAAAPGVSCWPPPGRPQRGREPRPLGVPPQSHARGMGSGGEDMAHRAFRVRLAKGVAVLVSCASPLLALDPQRPPSRYGHDAWLSQDGLPQDFVGSITQTPDGYLWIGTLGGLVRFDGVRFTVFDS